MTKKKQNYELLQVKDPVTRNILLAFIHKVHTKLCTLQQTVGYVPYYKGVKSSFIWTDMRKRGRSTYGEQPTITFTDSNGKMFYAWWNRHTDAKAEVIATPGITLEQIQELEEAFNDELADWNETLNALTRVSMTPAANPEKL